MTRIARQISLVFVNQFVVLVFARLFHCTNTGLALVWIGLYSYRLLSFVYDA